MEKNIKNCANRGEPEFCMPEIVDYYKPLQVKSINLTSEIVEKFIALCSKCENFKAE